MLCNLFSDGLEEYLNRCLISKGFLWSVIEPIHSHLNMLPLDCFETRPYMLSRRIIPKLNPWLNRGFSFGIKKDLIERPYKDSSPPAWLSGRPL